MNSLETSKDDNKNENVTENVDLSKIEAMVTDEQVLSDTVARRRRKFTKKRSTSLSKREPTPVRNVEEKITTSDDEEITTKSFNNRPKTPERPRRLKRNKDFSETASEPGGIVPTNGVIVDDGKKTNSLPRVKKEQRKSLSDLAQTEVVAFFNQTKKSISAAANRGRDRFRKNTKEQVKRSQSAPHPFTEEELIESFRKAQLLDNIEIQTPEIVEKKEIVVRKRPRSSKIIEILDPNVIINKRKPNNVVVPQFKFRDFIKILRLLTIKDIINCYKNYRNDVWYEYKKIRIQFNRCMSELFLIMIFCGIGGILFKFTEGSFENFYKCGVKRVKRDFIEQLWLKSHNLREDDWKSLARNKLRYFEEELHAAHEAGMTSYSGQRSWSFLNGVVYAITVITSIGYGHMYPTTTTGRALTIVYALIGIPLFLIALTDFGKLFTRCIKFLWSFVRRLYYTGSCRKVRKQAHVEDIFKGAQMVYDLATFRRPSAVGNDPENPQAPNSPSINTIGDNTDTPTTPAISNFEIDDDFNLPISVALFILVVYMFCGALIYCMWERWDFFASFYFVFISMSTIGFGDYVPHHPICTIVSIVYLVFGLALMSMCINVVQLKLSDTFKQASAKIGATIGLQVADEDGSITTVQPENVEIAPVHQDNVSDKEKKA